VIIGGLISATLLTLFVLPVVYMLFATREVRAPSDFNLGREMPELRELN
jgi:hypothetical protein